MVLLFLGNWRSTLIIALTIPLSILSSILALQLLGETLNLMTLGGLALSVGILVDQAIVTIENIERHLHLGTELKQAILVGAGEIGVPGVRVHALHLHRVRADVLPVRRRAVPVRSAGRSGGVRDDRVVHPVADARAHARHAADARRRTRTARRATACCSGSIERFDRQFERMRGAYRVALAALLAQKKAFARCSSAFACCRACCTRCSAATSSRAWMRGRSACTSARRPERGSRRPRASPTRSRRRSGEIVPPAELETILDNLGIPNSGINLSYSNAGTIGTLDGEILLSLKPGHRPTEEFVSALRAELPKEFPGIEFFFQPADIVTQILNFGLPAAIDVQFSGANLEQNAVARRGVAEIDPEDPRRGRRARPSADGRADPRPQDGSQPAAAIRPDRVQRRTERAGVAVGKLADGPVVLAQSAERCRLQRRRADAADQRRFARHAAQHAGRRNRRRGRRQHAAPGQSRRGHARPPARRRVALQHFARGRPLRHRAGHGPRQRRESGPGPGRSDPAEAPARQSGHDARAGADDASRRSSGSASGS